MPDITWMQCTQHDTEYFPQVLFSGDSVKCPYCGSALTPITTLELEEHYKKQFDTEGASIAIQELKSKIEAQDREIQVANLIKKEYATLLNTLTTQH